MAEIVHTRLHRLVRVAEVGRARDPDYEPGTAPRTGAAREIDALLGTATEQLAEVADGVELLAAALRTSAVAPHRVSEVRARLGLLLADQA